MCGRFVTGQMSFAEIHAVLQGFLDAIVTMDQAARVPKAGFHIQPTHPVAMVRPMAGKGVLLSSAQWQITSKGTRPLINARIENDSFWRAEWQARRCLIPALGYYEWTSESGRKAPVYITVQHNAPLVFFAGFYTSDGSECAILTRPPSPQIAHIHSRMPVILTPTEIADWLAGVDVATAQATLGTGWDGRFEWHPVGPLRRNSDGPELIEPYTPPQASFDF